MADIDDNEKRLLEAVQLAPPDEGNDEDTEVTVNLADLRELIGAAWEAHELAQSKHRKVRQQRGLIDELMRRERERANT